MADLQVQSWALTQLRPYPQNPRKNDPAIERMIASLNEFGFRLPILIRSDGTIIDGHLRARAAEAVGMTAIPAIVADDLTEAQVHAFRLLANRSVTWSDWDEELLRNEMRLIESLGADLTMTGFDDDEIEKLLADAGSGAELEPVPVAEFPPHTWVLVGIPTGRYMEIAEHIETIGLLPDVFVEVTANDTRAPQRRASNGGL